MSIQQQQSLNLFLLLLLGIFFSDFYLRWYEVGVILFFTIFIIWFISLIQNLLFPLKQNSSFTYLFYFSPLSTSIGVMLMMVSSHLWIYLVVIFLALLQKRYLTVNQKHFFNPSNFALTVALLFFYKDAHIVLGQLGSTWWIMTLLILLGIIILLRANRWIVSLSFILFYLLFQYLLVVGYDPIFLLEDLYYRFYSISFILFILFMLTDPKTTPHHGLMQVLFALAIAFLTAILDRYNGFRVQHLFLSLLLFSSFVPLAEKFSKRLLLTTLFIAFCVMVVIIIIENQPPYYFSMQSI